MKDHFRNTNLNNVEKLVSVAEIFTSEQLINLAVHRVISPEIIGKVLNIELAKPNNGNWEIFRKCGSLLKTYDKLGVLKGLDYSFFTSKGETSVHELHQELSINHKNGIAMPYLNAVNPKFRKEILKNTSREANMFAHQKALEFYKNKIAEFSYQDMFGYHTPDKFAKNLIEMVYHRNAINLLKLGTNIKKNIFDYGDLSRTTVFTSTNESFKLMVDEIKEVSCGKVGITQKLLFEMTSELGFDDESHRDPDFGSLNELFLKSYKNWIKIPIPINELSRHKFKRIKKAEVVGGWDIISNRPKDKITHSLAPLDEFLHEYQSGVTFDNLLILSRSEKTNYFKSNGVMVNISGIGESVSAIGIDKNRKIHIYDFVSKNKKFVWIKTGELVIKTIKESPTYVKIEYFPVAGDGEVFKNTLQIYSGEPDIKRVRSNIDKDILFKKENISVSLFLPTDVRGLTSVTIEPGLHKFNGDLISRDIAL